jgi:hypothetical protein
MVAQKTDSTSSRAASLHHSVWRIAILRKTPARGSLQLFAQDHKKSGPLMVAP